MVLTRCEDEVAEAKQLKRSAKLAAAEVAAETAAAAEADARALRKAAKRAAAEAVGAVLGDHEVELAEAKKVRGESKHAAAQLAAVASKDGEADPAEAKRLRKAAKRAAVDIAEAEVDPAEAKRLRKAAKLAAVEIAEAEVDPAEAKKLRKKARRATEAAAAAAAIEEESVGVEDGLAEAQIRRMEEQLAKPEKCADVAVADTSSTGVELPKRASTKSAAALTVFVGCLPFRCDRATLWKDFSECGEIEEAFMPSTADGRPGGFAFITYKTREGVAGALKYNQTDYGGRTLVVKIDGKVFVKGIANGMPDDEVRSFFERCGPIQSLNVPRWEDGCAKGMAHINFRTSEGLENALALNGTHWGHMRLTVQKAAQGGDGGKAKGSGKHR